MKRYASLFFSALFLALGSGTAGSAWSSESPSFKPLSSAVKNERQKTLKPVPKEPIDLSNASRAQLETLPGVGPLESQKILDARPLGSKTWLVTKGIISQGSYERIKKAVVAGTPSAEDAAKRPDLFGK